jgi:polar amino acid transport system substrate-binding protein
MLDRESTTAPVGRRSGRRLVAVGSALAGALLIAACGSSGGDKSAAGASAGGTGAAGGPASGAASGGAGTSSAAAMLPAKYKSSGKIVDASAFDYPPYDYTDAGGKYVGLEPDILQAIAPMLGVKISYTKLSGFASLVPAVSSGRVDMASSSIGVTTERLKQVGYAQYMVMREGLAVKKGNPKNISVDDLCGHSVAVETGAIEVDEYKSLASKCAADGKPKLDVQTFSSESAQVLAVSSGRVDAVAVGAVTVAELAKQNPQLEAVDGYVDVGTPPVPIGFAVGPDNPGLAQALAAALKELKDSGKLEPILAKYDINSDLVDVKYVASTK